MSTPNIQKIYDTFLEVCKTGPVLLLAPMTDPSHKRTKDPMLRFSPLLRLAVAASNLGITKLVFDPNEKYVAILGTVAAVQLLKSLPNYERATPTAKLLERAIIAVEAGSKAPLPKKPSKIPGLFLHWCELNAMFFDHAVSSANRSYKTSARSIKDRAVFNTRKKAHHTAILQVENHFQQMADNYMEAADRVFGGKTKKTKVAAKVVPKAHTKKSPTKKTKR